MRYYVLTPDGKNREITPEQYERLEMDNRNGWGDFSDKIGERIQKAIDKMDKVVGSTAFTLYDNTTKGAVNMGDKPREVGVKHDFSKPQMSLLPMKDLEGVVRVLEFGAKKYARGDWRFVENGAFRYLDAGLRHAGELTDATTIEELRVVDHESGLPAIDHAICSLIFARHFIFKGQVEINDK